MLKKHKLKLWRKNRSLLLDRKLLKMKLKDRKRRQRHLKRHAWKLLRKRRKLKQRLLNGRNLLKNRRRSPELRLLLLKLQPKRERRSSKSKERKIRQSMKLL